ncbi:hypothetical protein EVAR_80571_1 [Eumeta japonica]|uniref:Uncharacterized protein n=1 Tax=Eumeta variegata TaxID=151549 RepID=A0A4C1TNQ0_EUMVA|nr:hypothetical protein EVAR_80571_1 [Eumeta japonica]
MPQAQFNSVNLFERYSKLTHTHTHTRARPTSTRTHVHKNQLGDNTKMDRLNRRETILSQNIGVKQQQLQLLLFCCPVSESSGGQLPIHSIFSYKNGNALVTGVTSECPRATGITYGLVTYILVCPLKKHLNGFLYPFGKGN